MHLLALLTAAAGVINISSAIQPALAERLAALQNLMPVPILHASRIVVAVAGFALLILAEGLNRRKRVAWVWSLGVLGISLLTHLGKGLDFEEASFALVLIVLLLVFRNAFWARSDPGSLRKGALILLAALLFTLAYGTLGFTVLDHHFAQPRLATAFWQTVLLFTSPGSDLLAPVSQYGHLFKESLVFIGLGAFLIAVIFMLRPVLQALRGDQAQRQKAAAVIEEYGRTALCRALLFDDKSYFFHENSLVAFALSGGVVVALGDPVGPAEETLATLEAFKTYCDQRGWQAIFVSTLPDHLASYHQLGWESLHLGFEAMVPLSDFSLEGSKRKDLRNAVSRLQRSGFRAEVLQPPFSNALLADLREISDAWLRSRNLEELHYSDGAFDETYLSEGPLALILDTENKAVAFANLIHADKGNLVSIDLMRHLPDSQHGTMEALFVAAINWAKAQGASTFSLGLSAIAGVGEKQEDPRIEKTLHLLADKLKHYFNFSGLHVFKAKFDPDWQARYLIYPGLNSLPAAAAALIGVHSQKPILAQIFQAIPIPRKKQA